MDKTKLFCHSGTYWIEPNRDEYMYYYVAEIYKSFSLKREDLYKYIDTVHFKPLVRLYCQYYN